MNFQEKQQEYARLIVENGAAIQKGQELVLRCPAECWEFGRMIVKAGYEAGAKEVIVHWDDDEVARLRYEYAPMEVFENVPKWRADSMNSYAENGAAFIAITAENPNAFKGVDREKQGDGAVLQTDGVKPGAVGSGSCSGKRMGKASVSGKKRSTSHGKSVGSDLLRSKDSGWRCSSGMERA